MDTTVELANKVGASEIINRIVDDLKDENEQYRKMVMETIEKVTINILSLTTLTSESQFLPCGFELNHSLNSTYNFVAKRTKTTDRTEKLHQIFVVLFSNSKLDHMPQAKLHYMYYALTRPKRSLSFIPPFMTFCILLLFWFLFVFWVSVKKKNLIFFIFRPWVTWAHPMLIPVLRSSLLTESCMPFRNKLRR